MSDDEDDYLSDKFLHVQESSSSTGKTYSERRKEAERISALRNEQNRRKSRKQLEQEAREEGLSKSLFERAQEEVLEIGQHNKALAMMMKMGFKPGQFLGQAEPGVDEPNTATSDEQPPLADDNGPQDSIEAPSGSKEPSKSRSRHLVAPLPLNEWSGRTGIGVRKRAVSPNASERLAKMAKMAGESVVHTSFRDHARQEYEQRQAEARLGPAQRTCATLDEKAGRQFNVLSLNPVNPESFPEGLIDILEDDALVKHLGQLKDRGSVEGRLRAKMQADALQPLRSPSGLDDGDDDALNPTKPKPQGTPYSDEDLEECTAFLRLTAKDRLSLVLAYLRDRYTYCFWCGTQYQDLDDLEANCPGPEEDAHD